jgi:hypothetical protein
MRKKPDILLLLAVLVVSGVLVSNYVVIQNHENAAERVKAQLIESEKDRFKAEPVNPDLEFVRIDRSKQQNP